MNSLELESSEILEKLAEHDLLDAFYEAVDSDKLSRVAQIMRQAPIDEESINSVIDELQE